MKKCWRYDDTIDRSTRAWVWLHDSITRRPAKRLRDEQAEHAHAPQKPQTSSRAVSGDKAAGAVRSASAGAVMTSGDVMILSYEFGKKDLFLAENYDP